MGDQGGRDLDLALHEGEHNYHNIDLRSPTSPIIQQQQYKKKWFQQQQSKQQKVNTTEYTENDQKVVGHTSKQNTSSIGKGNGKNTRVYRKTHSRKKINLVKKGMLPKEKWANCRKNRLKKKAIAKG